LTKRILLLIAIVALTLPTLVLAQPTIKSKADQISITGRVHAQWRQTSIDGDPSNEFFIRRARATIKVKMNDIWSGVVQPDYGSEVFTLKGAFVRMEPNKNVQLTFGQTKRPFDLFELTSSTEHLVIERDGRIGRKRVPSLSRLTEKLGYSDRDIGLFVRLRPESKRSDLYVAVTNGSGASRIPEFGKKAYQGRVSVQPIKDKPWQLFAGVSSRPYSAADSVGATEKYASALEISTQWGGFKKGAVAQVGYVTGQNWGGVLTDYDTSTDFGHSPPTFVAIQGIVAYTRAAGSHDWFNSIRPLLRVSWADPNTDDDKGGKDDAGLVVTPGFDFVTNPRNRIAINVDIFKPQVGDTEFSTKVQSYLYW
jgi:hypothetical protein